MPPVTSSAAPVTPGAATGTGGQTPAGEIVVDVAGKVRRPGIVTLPAGSRVHEAIRAAGGLRPGATTAGLNLARRLVDGEQVVVGRPPAPTGQAPSGGATGGQDAMVDLNTATLEQLDGLPGVGPVLAQRILDYRTEHGGFRNVAQLKNVSGIGPSRFADLEPKVRV
ncbi:MAG: ComEA family DNA-binding protein [Streptosporangiales bacterium]|nr:ComEA family DNA-binding protein [Streptosporangiales bacterium]